MHPRSELQTLLKALVGSGEVYFQPPASIVMKYPCIVYAVSNADTKFADNNPYLVEKRYSITIIDKDPDSSIPDKVAKLQKCLFERYFATDNLNHFIYNIYF